MIIVLMILISLVSLYFTRFLSKRNMRAAAISVAVLYIYLVVWTYAIFILDIADLGFLEHETGLSLLHASDIYHSFISLTSRMSVLSLPILKAIVEVCILAVTGGLLVAFHGLFKFTVEFVKAIKSRKAYRAAKLIKSKTSSALSALSNIQIIRMYCRMNC